MKSGLNWYIKKTLCSSCCYVCLCKSFVFVAFDCSLFLLCIDLASRDMSLILRTHLVWEFEFICDKKWINLVHQEARLLSFVVGTSVHAYVNPLFEWIVLEGLLLVFFF